jgi:hypothetical protein
MVAKSQDILGEEKTVVKKNRLSAVELNMLR